MVVGCADALSTDVREAIVNEVRHEGVNDAVVALSPLFPRLDQSEMTKERELVAHGGHREA